jgi:hypothetical protein
MPKSYSPEISPSILQDSGISVVGDEALLKLEQSPFKKIPKNFPAKKEKKRKYAPIL